MIDEELAGYWEKVFEIDEAETKLADWDLKFIASLVDGYTDDENPLSDAQRKQIDRIHDRIFR